jgi:hypothetical protein
VLFRSDELVFDFDKLTGADINFCAREAERAAGGAILSLVISHDFHLAVAAKACGREVALLKKLGAVDYLEATTAAQDFCLGTDGGRQPTSAPSVPSSDASPQP